MRLTIVFILFYGFAYSQCELPCNDIKECIDSVYINSVVDIPTASDDQQLTSTVVDGVTTQIQLEDGGQVDILHPDIDLERCRGIYENSSNRSGNKFSVPNTTSNVTWTYTDWERVGTGTVTSPECVTDLQVVVNFGNRYWLYDDTRIYTYYDVRLLVNGAIVVSRISEVYDYASRRGNTFRDPELRHIGMSTFHRDNVPANATIEVEFRMRYNINGMAAGGSAQLPWAGIRSEASFSFNPNDEIVDVSLLSNESYWLVDELSELPQASAYQFGVGEAPDNAEIYSSKKEMETKLIEIQELFDEKLNQSNEITVSEKILKCLQDDKLGDTISDSFTIKEYKEFAKENDIKLKAGKKSDIINELKEWYKNKL